MPENKLLKENDLENVNGGTAVSSYTCKSCRGRISGHYWKASYTVKRGTGDTYTYTVSFCDDCSSTLKNDPKYFGWTEING